MITLWNLILSRLDGWTALQKRYTQSLSHTFDLNKKWPVQHSDFFSIWKFLYVWKGICEFPIWKWCQGPFISFGPLNLIQIRHWCQISHILGSIFPGSGHIIGNGLKVNLHLGYLPLYVDLLLPIMLPANDGTWRATGYEQDWGVNMRPWISQLIEFRPALKWRTGILIQRTKTKTKLRFHHWERD